MVGSANITRSLCAIAVLALALAAGCSKRRDPVTLNEGTVVVENQSTQDWKNVVISVDDHFRGGAPTLAAGGRLTAPLSSFQTAYGQRYDRAHQSVHKIEVTATAADGTPVALSWNGNPSR